MTNVLLGAQVLAAGTFVASILLYPRSPRPRYLLALYTAAALMIAVLAGSAYLRHDTAWALILAALGAIGLPAGYVWERRRAK